MKIKDIISSIQPLTFSQTLEYFVENAQKKGSKSFVVTINPEIIMLAKNDMEYEKVLKSANLAVADGVGVIWAGKIFGKHFKGRVHGSDLVEGVVKVVEKKPITVGFLGGKQNVALLAANCLKQKYPELKIAFTLEEWPRNKAPKCDILFVAFGSPKQEEWIHTHLTNLDVKIVVGVGGAFDFISGKVLRAPKFIRSIGFEWLFRLLIQPWRIKRQLQLPKFVILVLKERFF